MSDRLQAGFITNGVKVTVIERDLADTTGPRAGTAASFTWPQCWTDPETRPDLADDGDVRWSAFNAAEIGFMYLLLGRALPGIRERLIGDPGVFTFSQNAMCRTCPCSPGLVASRRLTAPGDGPV